MSELVFLFLSNHNRDEGFDIQGENQICTKMYFLQILASNLRPDSPMGCLGTAAGRIGNVWTAFLLDIAVRGGVHTLMGWAVLKTPPAHRNARPVEAWLLIVSISLV